MSTGRFVRVLFALGWFALATNVRTEPQRPADQFVTVNGVRLHYLDWGGTGDVVVFLPGLGESVHRFDSFASRFVDSFRVVGFTRRGQELSGRSAAPFDLHALADDVRGFLDVMSIRRATIVGHSIAGAEMTMFAGLYPSRVDSLVYLDAAYDYARAYELAVAGGLASGESEPEIAAIEHASRVHPDYARITAPALAFFVLYDKPYVSPQMSARAQQQNSLAFRILDGSGFKRDQIELFKREVKRGRVVEWHDTNHFFFQDPKHTDETVRLIREFILSR
ncbi:MAG TPA: alpha/beta hydrolase [Vicinamibacterales bacterium]